MEEITAIPPQPLLPFIDMDEQWNPWVDGPPLKYLTRGRKSSDSTKCIRDSSAIFSGWVSLLDPISALTTYGDMDGIRISFFGKHRHDVFFGNTRGTLPQTKHEFRKSKRRFNCIAREHNLPEDLKDEPQRNAHSSLRVRYPSFHSSTR